MLGGTEPRNQAERNENMCMCENCKTSPATVVVNADGWSDGLGGHNSRLCPACAAECFAENPDAVKVEDIPAVWTCFDCGEEIAEGRGGLYDFGHGDVLPICDDCAHDDHGRYSLRAIFVAAL